MEITIYYTVYPNMLTTKREKNKQKLPFQDAKKNFL